MRILSDVITNAYKEFEKKNAKRSDADNASLAAKTMEFFAKFGAMRRRDPADLEVRGQVKRLQEFFARITTTVQTRF